LFPIHLPRSGSHTVDMFFKLQPTPSSQNSATEFLSTSSSIYSPIDPDPGGHTLKKKKKKKRKTYITRYISSLSF
jgi:hypothetical protein